MRQLRALWGAVLISAAIAGGYFIVRGPTATPVSTLHMRDRRCRNGCTDSALLRVLPGGVSPGQTATGSLSGSNGQAITTTRASTKTCTRSDGVLVTLSSNQPCVESQGLLVEGAGSSIALWSQALDNAAWTKIGSATPPTVTADQAVAPDGTNTADRAVFPAVGASSYSLLRQNLTNSAGTYTLSVYVKGASSGSVYIAASAGNASYVTCSFNATAWTRCTNTATLSLNDSVDIGWNTPATGTGAGATIYFWGAQLEASPFATSYIPTAGASASRAADLVSVANPLPNSGAAWCVYETITPESGRAWNPGFTVVGWGLGTQSAANSAFSQVGGDTLIYTWVNGATGGAWYGYAAEGFAAGSSHRLGHCVSGTTITEYFDGVSQAITPGGTPVAQTGQSGNFWLGSTSGGAQLYGYVSDACVGSPGACQ